MEENIIEIIVGTYEEFLLGYTVGCTVQNAERKYSLTQTFANHSHTASIRCVALNATLLATGGADETIHLYDLNSRKEAGLLMHHNGTISCLEFSPDGCFLLSGGEDGVLAVHRTGSWVLEKQWGAAHKGSGVLEMNVHPSGKLALSVGADGTLCTWNLVKGRRAYTTRLTSSKLGGGLQISSVVWSPSGEFYAVAIASKVDVYSVKTAKVEYSISAERKVNSLSFLKENVLCIACDEGKIQLHNVEKKTCLSDINAHDQRVKCVASVSVQDTVYVASASSSGEIKFWKYRGTKLHELCTAKTGCRITCLTIATCGVPEHLADQETEEEKKEIMACVPLNQNVRRGVVVVELEEDDGNVRVESGTTGRVAMEKKKKKKRKRKLVDTDESDQIEKNFSVKPQKKKRTSQSSDTMKSKKKVQKAGSWKVVDTKKLKS